MIEFFQFVSFDKFFLFILELNRTLRSHPPISSVYLLFVAKVQSLRIPLSRKGLAQELMIERMWTYSDKSSIWARIVTS